MWVNAAELVAKIKNHYHHADDSLIVDAMKVYSGVCFTLLQNECVGLDYDRFYLAVLLLWVAKFYLMMIFHDQSIFFYY
jgi:hypothetical protein